jgi:hypothetical protein
VDRDHHAVPALRDDTRGEVALDDEVKSAGGVSTMEDDLAATEPASPPDRDEPPKLGFRQPREEVRVDHGRTVTAVTHQVSRARRAWKRADPCLVSWA